MSGCHRRLRRGGESLIFAASGFRCPLTELAEHLGADSGSVTGIYLPDWFARNLPAIHAPLIGLAMAAGLPTEPGSLVA